MEGQLDQEKDGQKVNSHRCYSQMLFVKVPDTNSPERMGRVVQQSIQLLMKFFKNNANPQVATDFFQTEITK